MFLATMIVGLSQNDMKLTLPLFLIWASGLALTASVVSVHLPGLFPVAMLPRIRMKGIFKCLRTEIVLPLLVWAVWVLIGFVSHQLLHGLYVGGLIALGIGAGYGSVWLSAKSARLQAGYAAPHPNPKIAPVVSIIMRHCYTLRAISVALSMLAALSVSWQLTTLDSWISVCILLVGCAAIALAVSAMPRYVALAEDALRTAPAALTALEKSTFACDVMLYCSDRISAKHLRIKSLNRTMREEELRTLIVAREPEAVPVLKTLGASRVWSVPRIAGLDAVVRPGLKAVFYTHDGIKNGHFTRFQGLTHILDATTGTLSKATTLSPALRMYDYVIAPSAEVAVKWRAPLTDTDARKILTLGLEQLMQTPHKTTLGPTSDVALCLAAPGSDIDTVTPDVLSKIAALIDYFRRTGDDLMETSFAPSSKKNEHEAADFSNAANLHISLPADQTSPVEQWQQSILEMGKRTDLPLVHVRREATATTWDRAEIAVVTTLDQFAKLRAAGKPMLWLGEGPGPEGACHFDTASNKPLFRMARVSDPDPLHFSTYRALLDHVNRPTSAETVQ